MSKFFAAFMAFIMMVLSWFGITPGGKPAEPETTTGIVTEEPTTEEPTTEEPATEEPTTEPDSPYVREDAYKTDIALHCAYIKDREPPENYPDTYSLELTDGMYASTASYTNAAMSGYLRLWESSMKIDIDLGGVHNKIYSFDVSYLATDGAGINIPYSVGVLISDDGASWTKVGDAFIPEMNKGTTQRASLTLDEYVSARYVRYAIYALSAFVFLDEVAVYADEAPAVPACSFEEAVNAAYARFGSVRAPSSGAAVDKTLGKTSVSTGKSYVYSGAAIAPFADNGAILTDARAANTYESGAYAGLEASDGQSITVDLGEMVSDIAGVELEAYSRVPSGIYLPAAVSFYAVDADGTKTALGTRYAKTVNETGSYTFSLELNNTVAAQKIEVCLAHTPCTRLFLVDEINVYARRAGTAVTEPCYEPIDISLAYNGEWDADEADFTENKNLLLGCPSQIIAQRSMTADQNARNTRADSGLLTDGVHSPGANIYNGYFQIFYTCKSRQIVFDLEKVSALNKFTLEFTNFTGWAVYAPEKVKVFLSENGSDWYYAGDAVVDTSADGAVVNGSLELSSAVKARYLCFELNIKTFAGCSEIEAFGTKSTASAVSLSDANFEKRTMFVNSRIAPSEDILNGAKDTCLLYHSKSFGYTPETLLPYVAYIDGNGEIADTMFDSFLFLMSGDFPSGLPAFGDGKLTDWQWCIEDLFKDGENILALEQAAGTAKQALGLPEDYVYPFTVAVYCPNINRTDFGDVDGDGINEDMSTDEGRIKALNAYSDMFESKLAQYDFKNIKFSGYYWMKESMDTANRDDAVAKAFSEYIHEKGYDFIWIPYFDANGYNCWSNYGFDCAVMQPNYMFRETTPYTNITDTAKLIELYGMGIEIEVDNSALNSDTYFKRYMKYLSGGVKYGYMDDTISMYYQDLLIYYYASNSTAGRQRLVYDNTYGYIKGTLDIYPDALDTQHFSCAADTILNSALTLPASPWHDVIITEIPSHGTLTPDSKGGFSYYPEKGFRGTVEFKFAYSTSFEYSGECTAVITID